MPGRRRRPRNQRLTSNSERRKQYFIQGVVKRGESPTWQGVRRWTGRLFKVLLLAAVTAGIYFGVTHGWRKLFWQNPDYSLREIHFTTDGSLTREQALQVMKLKTGQNIFAYNINAATEALRKMPQVDAAEVRRYLPDRIDISVRERMPAAWVVPSLSERAAHPEQSYLLDARGLVFQPKDVPYEFRTLPVIGGVQIGDLEPGKRIRKAEVDAALELLRRTNETAALKVKSIDVSKGYWMVATDQHDACLTFGLDDIPGQLDRLATVQSEVALIGQEIKTINLIPVRNIPVTFMPPTAPQSDDLEETPPPAETKPDPKAAAAAAAKSKPKTPAKKSEPTKPKDDSKGEGTGLLKRFRAA